MVSAKTVAIVLCIAALIVAFMGWAKRPPTQTLVTLAPAITLPPTIASVIPTDGTMVPGAVPTSRIVNTTMGPLIVTPTTMPMTTMPMM